jgi:eukaryotic-like serine/threonine-protein kinase
VTVEGGLVAGRYRLGERIGSGAMGIVWQAHDERLHRTVAVKQLLLQPGLTEAQAEEARRRCMREGRIAARLSHPNAITVYDVAEHDADPWLVMEYLPSKSLATVLSEQGTIPPHEAARIGTQIAAALVAAHAAGIVHRDIKPANVLLGQDGTVKITDFGISRATGDVTVTATGMLAGTPAYLAPEVAKGEDPTPAADVFSLGSTLYTAVEGHSPFGLSENTLALLYAVAAGKISPPRQAGPLTALLMRLLRVEPGERPSITATRDALAAIAEGRPMPPLLPADAPTDRMRPAPMPMPMGPQTPPRPATPPQGLDATRLDARPFSEPAPSGPNTAMHREPVPPPSHPPPHPAAARAATAPGQRPNRTRSVVLTILAIVAAIVVGILVASLFTDDKGKDNANGGDTPSTSSQEQAPPPEQNSQPTTEPTTTTTTTTTTTEPAGPSAADYERAVRDYYALLPGQPDAAFARMTPNAQNKSKGRDSYVGFWQTIQSVQVLAAQARGNQVDASLLFTRKDGTTSNEKYHFTLVEQGAALLIDDFSTG